MAVILVTLDIAAVRAAPAIEQESQTSEATIRIDQGHPWRPPFGIERIGRPLIAVVDIPARQEGACEYALVAYLNDQQISRSVLTLTGEPPFSSRIPVDPWPTLLVLECRPSNGTPMELARKALTPPPFEADAFRNPSRASTRSIWVRYSSHPTGYCWPVIKLAGYKVPQSAAAPT